MSDADQVMALQQRILEASNGLAVLAQTRTHERTVYAIIDTESGRLSSIHARRESADAEVRISDGLHVERWTVLDIGAQREIETIDPLTADAMVAAFSEGYTQGVSHPKGASVIARRREVLLAFLRRIAGGAA